MRKTVYLSLGSNLGDRAANLGRGLQLLGKLGEVTAVSSLFETEPVEVEGQQGWFLNGAAAVETELIPSEFLSQTLAIERVLGRRREGSGQRPQKPGPRTLDIDILFFGKAVIEGAGLTVPHPAIEHRRFVLEPLAEIAPDLLHPVLNRTIKQLLDALPVGVGIVRKYEDQECWKAQR